MKAASILIQQSALYTRARGQTARSPELYKYGAEAEKITNGASEWVISYKYHN
jgi:hypothetical protein